MMTSAALDAAALGKWSTRSGWARSGHLKPQAWAASPNTADLGPLPACDAKAGRVLYRRIIRGMEPANVGVIRRECAGIPADRSPGRKYWVSTAMHRWASASIASMLSPERMASNSRGPPGAPQEVKRRARCRWCSGYCSYPHSVQGCFQADGDSLGSRRAHLATSPGPRPPPENPSSREGNDFFHRV